jgi:hypothetical protein
MTASQKPKTPSMNLAIKTDLTTGVVDSFCKRASRLNLSQVIDNITVTEAFVVDGEERRTRFTVHIAFFPKDEYKAEYDVDPSEILEVFAAKFPLTLKKEMQLEMKKLDADLKSQIADLGKGKASKTRGGRGGEEDEDGEAGSVSGERGDDEEEDWKRVKEKQQTSYDFDDESEGEDWDFESNGAGESAIDEDSEGDGAEDPDVVTTSHRSGKLKKAKLVERLFIQNMYQATSFAFTETTCTFQIEVRSLQLLITVGGYLFSF